jgi:2-deoxy-D-gluconate 3-dehydrogenase
MALGLRAAGARVAVTGRKPEKNEAIGRELGDSNAVFFLDVRDEEAIENVVHQIVDRFGRLDILINNAGLIRQGSLIDLTREDWDEVIETHLTGTFLCGKHAARAMIARGEGGKIINIGSMFSIFGLGQHSNYVASKTGLLGLTRALAVELAVYNIQVNAILPGWYETDLIRGLPETSRGEEIRRKTPAGRWGMAEDLVGTTIYLASSASNFVTGVCIPVDGGYAVAESFRRE